MTAIPTVTATVVGTVDATASPLLGQAYGPDLLTNGNFDAALTGWTKGGGTPDWVGAESPASSGNYVAVIVGTIASGVRTLTQTITGLTNGAVYRIDAMGTMGVGNAININAEGGTVISVSGAGAYLKSGEFTAVGTEADIVITTVNAGSYFENVDIITVREKL